MQCCRIFTVSTATPHLRRLLGSGRERPLSAREDIATLIGAHPDEVVFTSGGTESSNHAILGLTSRAPSGRRKVVTSMVEHPAIEMPCRRLADRGFDIVRVPVTGDGVIDIMSAASSIDHATALVTIIHAQNETGVLQPVEALAASALRVDAPVHIDASQSIGKVSIDVGVWGITALTIAGHKLYAPKGIGALYIRRGYEIPSLIAGAGQEHGRRPGTENVAYITGLGRAAVIAARRLKVDAKGIADLRNRLWTTLASGVPGLIRVGDGAPCLPNTLNVLFPRVSGQALLAATPQIAAATGSACHAGETKPSSIILAHGYSPEHAAGAVRLTLGRQTTQAEVDNAATALVAAWTDAARGLARPDPPQVVAGIAAACKAGSQLLFNIH